MDIIRAECPLNIYTATRIVQFCLEADLSQLKLPTQRFSNHAEPTVVNSEDGCCRLQQPTQQFGKGKTKNREHLTWQQCVNSLRRSRGWWRIYPLLLPWLCLSPCYGRATEVTCCRPILHQMLGLWAMTNSCLFSPTHSGDICILFPVVNMTACWSRNWAELGLHIIFLPPPPPCLFKDPNVKLNNLAASSSAIVRRLAARRTWAISALKFKNKSFDRCSATTTQSTCSKVQCHT